MKTLDSWHMLVPLIEEPEAARDLSDKDFEALGLGLSNNGLLALFSWRAAAASNFPEWPEDRRQALGQRLLMYKARWAVLSTELEKVLGLLSEARLEPILLKGSHLALAYYEQPYLRPMSDLDLGFTTLSEAERAYELLKRVGYETGGQGLSGDPWAYDQHLPPLSDLRTGLSLEVHGSLIYPPKDKRHAQTRALFENLEDFRVGQLGVKVLCPEAIVVHIFAHALEHHKHIAPKLLFLYDVRNVLKGASSTLDPDKLVSLAIRSGFESAVGNGLRMLRSYMGVRDLVDILGPIEEAGALQGAEPLADRLSAGSKLTELILARIACAGGALGPPLLAWHYFFPPPTFMRVRYSGRSGWPLTALYLFRWWDHTRKVARYAGERLGLLRGAKRSQG